jgi:large subunit ribosomal protein L21
MDYAVIQTGGKQYRVQEGDQIAVEKLTAEVGKKITLDQILMVNNKGKAIIGTPQVEGAKVEAEVIDQGKAKKITVFKKKRRKGYSKKQGHRQEETTLKILKISG